MIARYILCHLALLIFTLPTVGQEPKAEGSGSDKLGRPTWLGVAKPQVSQNALDPHEALVRAARDGFFDSPTSSPLTPHDILDKAFPSGGGFDELPQYEAIPLGESDVVVIASVLSFQPFLSTSRSMVYSELTTVPSEILNDKDRLLKSGQPFVILQRGGTIRLASGKVVNAVPYGSSNPLRIAQRYLLFLNYHKGESAYTVVKVWDLSQPKPQELDNEGHPLNRPSASVERKYTSEEALKQQITVSVSETK